jgi:hypothetical protein
VFAVAAQALPSYANKHVSTGLIPVPGISA